MQPGGATLTLLVVAAVGAAAGVGFGSALAATNQPDVVSPTADVDYTCRNVTVSVEPKWVSYSLVVTYRDTATGDEGKALVGPMNGTVTEPYGPEFVFTSVEVVSNGASIETGYLPARCYPDDPGTSDRTSLERSSIRASRGVADASDRSRKPVPVATATT